MRSLFTILLAAALAIPTPRAQAQNTSDLTLKGRTVNDKGAVVDYATVSVSSVQDSTKTYGTVGDDKGAFEVRLPRGDYRLKISFMGYENLERQIELNSDTDLGDLTMHPSAVTLDEVVVTGNIITREADRFIVNLANTPLAIGRDGKEIMSLAPGVWISEKGEISVNGRKGTRVMVNDRMLRETGEDLLAYLQNLKAEDILKIEVIPYAGAEYDADMTSGIIKITLKKQRNDGMEGSATMRYGHSLVNDMTWYLQPAVNLKYRNNKLSLYTDFSLNRNKSGNTVSGINQFHTGDQVTQTSGGKLYNLGSYKTLRVGGVYDIDDRQSVGLEVNYTHSPSTGNNRNDLTMQSGDEVTDVQSLYLSDNLNYRISVSGNYILNLDTLGSTFKLLLDYNRRNGDDHSDYHSLYSGFRNLDSTYRSDIITLNNIYSATADFDIALSKVSKLTTGIKYTNNGMDNSTLYEYLKNESWHEIGALTNLNKYNENISALYAKFSTRFKNNFALSLGLRGEYTYAVPSTSSTVITDKQNYFGLFPNANLSMPLNKKAEPDAYPRLQPQNPAAVVLGAESVPQASFRIFVYRRQSQAYSRLHERSQPHLGLRPQIQPELRYAAHQRQHPADSGNRPDQSRRDRLPVREHAAHEPVVRKPQRTGPDHQMVADDVQRDGNQFPFETVGAAHHHPKQYYGQYGQHIHHS